MLNLAAIRPRVQLAAVFDVDRLTGPDVAHPGELQHVQRHALRGDHVVGASLLLARTEHQRPYAVGVAERDDAETDDHHDDGVAAAAAPVHGLDRVEDIVRRRPPVDTNLQLVREHVEQDLGVGVRVQVAPVLAYQELGEFVVIRQVAVMRKADPVGRIHVERLRFRRL